MKKMLFPAGLLAPFVAVAVINWFPNGLGTFVTGDFGGSKVRTSVGYVAEHTRAIAGFFGTSRTRRFETVLFDKIQRQPSVNMAIPGGSVTEMRYYFEHAQNVRPLQTAVIELNYLLFTDETKSDFSKERLLNAETMRTPLTRMIRWAHFPQDAFSSLFSPQTLMLRLQTAYLSKQRALIRKIDATSKLLDQLQKYKPAPVKRTTKPLEEGEKQFHAIMDIARKNNTQLRLYLPPLPLRVEEQYYGKNFEEYLSWKRRILGFIEAEKGDLDVQLWDFSGYNSVTTEPLAKKNRNRWFESLTHFNAHAAGMIFDRMYGTCAAPCAIPPDFGILLTPGNIEIHLQETKRQRDMYKEREDGTLSEAPSAD